MKSFENNPVLAQFITPESELNKISATECVLVFHGVKHGHSYRSQECVVELIRAVFQSSSLAKSISCGRTKARSIACNVLGPYFTNRIINDLLKSRFYSLSVDASNRGHYKMFPFAVQYFSETGVSRGLIDFVNDPDESAVDIFENICRIINDYKLQFEHLTSYRADNANVNYGKHHSVFTLLRDKAPHLMKGNCYGHVLHNAVKTVNDYLPIDIETILCKLYSYFSRSAKRVESLKDYFQFVQVDFNVLLKHISIRWLSLLRSIERLLENLEPLKLFCINEPTSTNVQRLLKSFFDNNESLCILYFLQNVLVEIQKAELQLQRSYTTAVDLYFIITNLIEKLRQKLSDKYYGNNTRLVLNLLKEIDETKGEELMKEFDLFVNKTIEYIESYFDDDKDQLYSEFCEMKSYYDYVKKHNIKLDDQVKSYISTKTNDYPSSRTDHQIIVFDDNEQITPTQNNQDETSIRSDQLWAYLLNTNPNSTPNFKKIICYIFFMPCSKAYVETIFSPMKHAWSDYRNKMETELLSSELKIRMNGNFSCQRFYQHVLSETELLKEVRKNAKYK